MLEDRMQLLLCVKAIDFIKDGDTKFHAIHVVVIESKKTKIIELKKGTFS